MCKKHILSAPLCLLLLLLAFGGCKTDLDVNAPWKETAVVYGLLDFNQTRQYIRVQKTFQNGSGSAYDYAKITDSLYFKSLTVKLINQNNGQEIICQKDNSIPMEPGIFANDSNFLYYTDQKLDKNAAYELLVINNETGKTYSSITSLVDSATWRNPSRQLVIPFEVKANQNYSVSWETGRNARMYDLLIRVHYTDYLTDNQGNIIDSVNQTLDWNAVKNQATPNMIGGDRQFFSITQVSFFNFLVANIPVKNNVKRKAYRADFRLYGASEDFTSYILINAPSFGVVQKSTQYTNITDGLGIFSSRSLNEIKDIPFTGKMQNDMAGSATLKKLNFF